MSSETPFEITAELLNDFYTECDEHLRTIRETLATLETAHPSPDSRTPLLEQLFRSFHSLKGISGIVGLRASENLAHQTEDYLKELTRNPARLDEQGLNLLMSATQKLEHVAAAHHENKPLPEVDSLAQRLEAIIHSHAPQSAAIQEAKPAPPNTLTGKIRHMEEQGFQVWKFLFAPSPALDQRGINVTAVRQQLQQHGELLESKPLIEGAGSIRFQFIVALRQAPSGESNWPLEGVTGQPFPELAVAPPPEQPQSQAGNSSAPPLSTDSHSPFVAPSHVVRVDMSRLDELMRITGEMVVERARLDEQVERVLLAHPDIDGQGLLEVQKAFSGHLRDLREAIMRVRMVPVSEVFGRMPFAVRDLAQETGKSVKVQIIGQETEIDKYVVERIKDPMLHLVRNAVSHGIESPAERAAQGKPAEALITLSAKTIGDQVLIEIADNGRGINPESIKQKALAAGLRVPADFEQAALLEVLCTPGFSTREEADRGSGRGMGMSVVIQTLRELGGSLGLHSRKGEGTRFTLRLPLTLAVADAMIVKAGHQRFAIPQAAIEEIVPMDSSRVQGIENARLFLHRGKALPLYSLDRFLGTTSPARPQVPVLIMETERGRIGLQVQQVTGQREVVVRSLRDPLLQVPGIAGATELGDGLPILILEIEGILRAYKHQEHRHQPAVHDLSSVNL
jgi:two-component system chemotaxis sensor kinase CheA